MTMKYLLTALVLTIAAPALAQNAGGADAHAGHGSAEHSRHAGHDGGCCGKDAQDKKACCDKMQADGKKMACCEKGADKKAPADAHAGHGKH
jgi:hypothetical protein